MALFGHKSELERIAAALEHLARLYSIDLSSRGLFTEVGTDEGEILHDDRSPEAQFDRDVEARDYDDAEQKRAHEEYLRELEREALRLFTPSGLVPGTGPEGAEDPAASTENYGPPGNGPASGPEGPGDRPEQEGEDGSDRS